jgi:DNA-binding response OmpR family regulator
MRILVVDDDVVLARSVARSLVKRGHDVETAADPGVALEQMGNQHFDLVLCDLQMPTMYGTVFIERVRARYGASAPLLALVTGHDRLAECGVADCAADTLVIKPMSSAKLASIVSSAARKVLYTGRSL